LQRIANDPSVDVFVGSFPVVRHEVKRHLGLAGFDFTRFEDILDLGCGVGRFMFAFRTELGPRQRLWGCDAYEECADWCRRNIPFATILHTNIEPPLPFEDGGFDLVYALSVFTHLRLDLQFRWVWEVHRILRPGGVLFATLHGPHFFPVLYGAACAGAVHRSAISTFGDEGLFAYMDVRGNADDQGQVDVAAAHSSAFAHELFSPFCQIRRFPQSLLGAGQDVYVLQKPFDARPIL
jgi:SAM-dependent methyltransferase